MTEEVKCLACILKLHIQIINRKLHIKQQIQTINYIYRSREEGVVFIIVFSFVPELSLL